jgi:hypothetical protein
MQSNPRLINYFMYNAKPYFQEAEDFVRLSKTYAKQDLMVLFDMYGSPLILILTVIFTKKPPSMISLLGLYRIFQVWVDYFRYNTLRAQFYQWSEIMNAVGGPYISTNDPQYHPYVIADGMQRTQTELFTNRIRHRGCPTPEIRK